MTEPFGFLLAIDLYDCRNGVCDDFDLCYRFLDEVVRVLKMKRQAPPYLFRSDEREYPNKTGLSGWIPLIESGIQIHTLSQRNFISIDVYSCRRFDTEGLEEFVREFFHPSEVETQLILRGTRYYQE